MGAGIHNIFCKAVSQSSKIPARGSLATKPFWLWKISQSL